MSSSGNMPRVPLAARQVSAVELAVTQQQVARFSQLSVLQMLHPSRPVQQRKSDAMRNVVKRAQMVSPCRRRLRRRFIGGVSDGDELSRTLTAMCYRTPRKSPTESPPTVSLFHRDFLQDTSHRQQARSHTLPALAGARQPPALAGGPAARPTRSSLGCPGNHPPLIALRPKTGRMCPLVVNEFFLQRKIYAYGRGRLEACETLQIQIPCSSRPQIHVPHHNAARGLLRPSFTI